MQLRRPYVLRHRVTGAIKHSSAVSGEEGGLWEMLLTDGSPEANRLAAMEEASHGTGSGKKQQGKKAGRKQSAKPKRV